MGYKTENWQDIEVGDVIEVLSHNYGPPLTLKGEKIVQEIVWKEGWGVCLSVYSDQDKSRDWALIVSDDSGDQVKLIRKHNANS